MNHKKILVSTIAAVSILLTATPVMAHVVVKPNEVGVAAYQTFTVGVPVEKDLPTTELRLVIPEGLKSVTPNVKTGWTIDVTKEGEGEDAKVTEIIWSGGSIPAGQRDEFLFSAQAPAKETSIAWKAYQTYEDGEVVSWDSSEDAIEAYEKENADSETEDANAPKPYSQTKVINDLKASEKEEDAMVNSAATSTWPMVLSIAAIALSAAALIMQMRRKK